MCHGLNWNVLLTVTRTTTLITLADVLLQLHQDSNHKTVKFSGPMLSVRSDSEFTVPYKYFPHLLAQFLNAVDDFTGNAFIHHGLVRGDIQQHQDLVTEEVKFRIELLEE